MKMNMIYLTNKEDFDRYLDSSDVPLYILIDPSNITDFAIKRRLMRRSSICLFEGAEWDNMSMFAPYILRAGDLNDDEKQSFFAAFAAGDAVLFESQRDIHDLKRALKKLIIQPSKEGFVLVNKFYTAINFLFYLETDKRFLKLLELMDHVLCRTFDEPYQYVKIEA